MGDRLRDIWKKIQAWWEHFTTKQKTIIVSIVAGVVVMFALLFYFLGRPQYEILVKCEDTKEASQVTALLADEYKYTTSQDGLTISVLSEQAPAARILLGANDISSSAYGIENVFVGGFSTTESDKQKRYLLYLESKFEQDCESYVFVKTARVTLNMPESDGTLLSVAEESNANVILETEGEVPVDAPRAIAKTIANALGNKDMDNITIIDTEGNLLFASDTDMSASGTASTQLTVKQQAENVAKAEVKKVLLGTGLYSTVEVKPNLVIDFSSTEKASHAFSAPDGQTLGMLGTASIYTEDSTNGSGGVPGTDSNTDQSYVYEDTSTSTSSISDEDYTYENNEDVVTQSIPAGTILYNDSSISVSAKYYKIVKEEEIKLQGLLDGVTWEEYKMANSEPQKLTVDEEVYGLVSMATGISVDNIVIVAYEEPLFYDTEGLSVSIGDVVQIAVFILIIGLLVFVVLRSMSKNKEIDEEEELSVESLLQSTPEAEVENIGLESKSETRKMIEKFVTDNSEAAANLLRNWLSEDWG